MNLLLPNQLEILTRQTTTNVRHLVEFGIPEWKLNTSNGCNIVSRQLVFFFCKIIHTKRETNACNKLQSIQFDFTALVISFKINCSYTSLITNCKSCRATKKHSFYSYSLSDWPLQIMNTCKFNACKSIFFHDCSTLINNAQNLLWNKSKNKHVA